jgi:lactate dehydrogenase-like 2-hydroxyacid dehydrogenase
LLETLRKDRVSGAALDVFEIEPLLVDSSRRSEEWGKEGKSNVFLIPRMGYVEEGVLNRWYEETAENLEQ